MTVYYPEEQVQYPIAYRGRPVLAQNEDGQPACVACGLCEIACPAYCIHIEPGQNTGKQNQYERWPDVFNIDYAICIFCGNCEEACPEEAIFMSDDCEISMLDRKQMLYTKEQLLTPVADLQKRIEFTRNMYAKWNY